MNEKKKLIAEKLLTAENENGENTFLLEAGDEQLITIIFIGTWDGKSQKSNRLLPPIEFREVE